MIVFRLSKSINSLDLSGKGAERNGGRWNSKGIAMLYTSQSRALCATEIAVHTPLGIIPTDYKLVTIAIPDNLSLFEIKTKKLPHDWMSFPHPNSTRKIGDRFITNGKYLVLKVPSVVVTGDYNFLVNPFHQDIKKIIIIRTESFQFDERLFIK